MLDSWVPHIIFKVSHVTSSVALWSTNKKKELFYGKNQVGIRMNYYLKNHKILGIDENSFFNEISINSNYEEDSEKHIQAICYFMQNVGYKNKSFISKILKCSNTPEIWHKYLSCIVNEENIAIPYFESLINTLGLSMSLEEVRKI